MRSTSKSLKRPRRSNETPPSKVYQVPEEEHVADSVGTLVNANGISALPVELLTEIMSYIPGPVDPLSGKSRTAFLTYRNGYSYTLWRNTLLSLSQTCRRMRRLFEPQLWRRIDVWGGIKGNSGEVLPSRRVISATYDKRKFEKQFNEELIRQLEIVTVRNPGYSQYVQIIDIEISEFSFKPVIAELARCLALFSNLQFISLYIIKTKRKAVMSTSLLKSALAKCTFPRIRSVSVDSISYPLLGCCPGARSVSFRYDLSHTEYGYRYEKDLDLPLCLGVEKLELTFPFIGYVEDITSAFPNVREFVINWEKRPLHDINKLIFVQADWTFLDKMKRVQSLEIYNFEYTEESGRKHVADVVENVLRRMQKEDGLDRQVIMHWLSFPYEVCPTVTERMVLRNPQRPGRTNDW